MIVPDEIWAWMIQGSGVTTAGWWSTTAQVPGAARYRRAPWLPEDLVERLRGAVEDGFDDQDAHSILSDILAWHEGVKEKKDE